MTLATTSSYRGPLSKGTDRFFDKDEYMLYLIGMFEFGETVEVLAREHNRLESFIELKLEEGLKDVLGSHLALYYFERGKNRAKKLLEPEGRS